jgi:hypothetical protein
MERGQYLNLRVPARSRRSPAFWDVPSPAPPEKRSFVTAVTSRWRGIAMVTCIEPKVQEVAMAATKKIGKRFVRWFKTFREQNRPPYKYHEHSLYDA